MCRLITKPLVKVGQAGKSTGKSLFAPWLSEPACSQGCFLARRKVFYKVSLITAELWQKYADPSNSRKLFFPRCPFDFCSTSGIATVCREPKELRGRNATTVEVWLLCRKHHPPPRQMCPQSALVKRGQGMVCGGEQKWWHTVELVSERMPHLQSFWISRQEQ